MKTKPTQHAVALHGDRPACVDDIAAVAHGAALSLDADCWRRIANARAIVERIVADGTRAYGINTGLGGRSDISLTADQASELSRRTLMSHACGVGTPLTREQVRAIMAAQVVNFSLGHSGVSASVVRQLIDCLNHGVTPVVPSQGSLGYLSHMAHIGLVLIGLGEAEHNGKAMPAAAALDRAGLQAITLGTKDGLSLVNGLPCTTGLLCLALSEADRLARSADALGAMSFEALRGQIDAFDEEALAAKPYPGQVQVGANLRALLEGSAVIASSAGIRTQDALSVRAIPQVHGAIREQLAHAARLIAIELRSANDNPLVFGTPEAWRVVSQANPHGEAMSLAASTLAIAVAELAGMSERRIDRLVNPLVSGLPPFLVAESGLNSGLMIAQYVAASLVSENKLLAQPVVLDNFVTSGLQEDHLSLGTLAALNLLKVLANARHVLAIEYLAAAQGLYFHGGQRLGQGTAAAVAELRKTVPPYLEDRIVSPDITAAEKLLRDGALLHAVEAAIGRPL